MRMIVEQLVSFISVMHGQGADCIIPEEVQTPLGVPVKLGAIMRDAAAAIARDEDAEKRVAAAVEYITSRMGPPAMATHGNTLLEILRQQGGAPRDKETGVPPLPLGEADAGYVALTLHEKARERMRDGKPADYMDAARLARCAAALYPARMVHMAERTRKLGEAARLMAEDLGMPGDRPPPRSRVTQW